MKSSPLGTECHRRCRSGCGSTGGCFGVVERGKLRRPFGRNVVDVRGFTDVVDRSRTLVTALREAMVLVLQAVVLHS